MVVKVYAESIAKRKRRFRGSLFHAWLVSVDIKHL